MERQTTQTFILLGLAAMMLTDMGKVKNLDAKDIDIDKELMLSDMDGCVEKVENLDANDIDADEEMDEIDDADEYLNDQETQSAGAYMSSPGVGPPLPRADRGQPGPRGGPNTPCKYVNEKVCKNTCWFSRYVRFCFYRIVRVC